MKRKVFVLLCLILFIVSISSVSANDDLNQTVIGEADDFISDVDTLCVSDETDVVIGAGTGTFTELQEKIDNAPAGSVITLNKDYRRGYESEPDKIKINKALTINGNGYTIDVDGSYYGQSKIFYITSGNVVLNNINFANAYVIGHYSEEGSYNGGAIYAERNIVLNNCNFNNCYIQDGYGAAIYSTADVTANNCVFSKNSGSSNSGYAASTVISAKNVVAKACSFYDNSYTVPIDSDNDLTVENSIFRNNTGALGAWGKVTVKKSDFINNNAYSNNRGSGGAIASGGDLTVEDCTFEGNYAYRGGAISSGGNAEIYNCRFINNSASSSGGAVYLGSESEVNIANSNFTKNSAGTGGAIFINGKNHIFHSLNFIENSASYGGALTYGECMNTVVNNCNFIKNSANSYGGAIYWDYIFNYIENCYFEDNYCWSGEMISFDESLGLIYKEGNLVSKISNIKIKQNLSNLYAEGISLKDNILTVHGYYNGDFLSGDITVNIAGKTFKKSLDSYGSASFDLNGLSGGIHDATISCVGESGASTSEFTIPIPIESSIRLDVPDVTKNYGGSESLQITLTESGSPVTNAKVSININGGTYTRTTDSKGKASMPINLNAGSYPVSVTYGDISADAKVVVNQLSTKTALTYVKNTHNSVTLTATLNPSAAGGKVTFDVNGKKYSSDVSGGKATYGLTNLAIGHYTVKATYGGDANYKSSSSGNVNFDIEEYSVIVEAPEVTKFYGGPERFYVTVKDNSGNPIANAPVVITINGQSYSRTTGTDGKTSIPLGLNFGKYRVSIEYGGETYHSTATIKSSIEVEDITLMYKNGTRYHVKVSEDGKAVVGKEIRLNINGVFYYRTTNSEGSASIAINLPADEYIVTAERMDTHEKKSSTITVKPLLIDNKDVDMFFRNGTRYTVKVIKQDGKVAGAGEVVRFNINGVFYERKTNNQGIAGLNLNLEPNDYIITAEYNDFRVSNSIKIKPTLSASNLFKKFGTSAPFTVKVLDGQGKALANANVTFNINGVFYNRMSNSDGVAKLNINLMAGEYIITSSFNGGNIANNVTIIP